ncbi:MAG: hypothetical protein ACT4O1_15495 [Gemmatimonadota bacterium]
MDRELADADPESKREYDEIVRRTHRKPLKLVLPTKVESKKGKRIGSNRGKGSK